MNSYEAKRQARIERLRDRADRLSTQATAAQARASSMASVIPFGQPILVGHYSEGRDRRYRDRIHRTFVKGFELAKEAQDVERRADAAERNTAISSDDPEAVDKLQEKIARLKAEQAHMVAVNRALRGKKTDDEISALTGGALTPAAVAELRKPDFCGRTGYADYQLKNNSSNIRRLEQRAGHLASVAEQPAKPPETIGEVRIEETDNRVRVFFPGKPSEAIRTELKRNGFRWAPSEGAWQTHAKEYAWHIARKVAAMAAPTEPVRLPWEPETPPATMGEALAPFLTPEELDRINEPAGEKPPDTP